MQGKSVCGCVDDCGWPVMGMMSDAGETEWRDGQLVMGEFVS